MFQEVQNSNMSKLGADGKPIYNEFGKVMKGPKYFKPNLEKLINEDKIFLDFTGIALGLYFI